MTNNLEKICGAIAIAAGVPFIIATAYGTYNAISQGYLEAFGEGLASEGGMASILAATAIGLVGGLSYLTSKD